MAKCSQLSSSAVIIRVVWCGAAGATGRHIPPFCTSFPDSRPQFLLPPSIEFRRGQGQLRARKGPRIRFDAFLSPGSHLFASICILHLASCIFASETTGSAAPFLLLSFSHQIPPASKLPASHFVSIRAGRDSVCLLCASPSSSQTSILHPLSPPPSTVVARCLTLAHPTVPATSVSRPRHDSRSPPSPDVCSLEHSGSILLSTHNQDLPATVSSRTCAEIHDVYDRYDSCSFPNTHDSTK